ncbi:MAG TPA: hypothetical protein VIV60_14780 [Polyangiaceae bacterium]
MSHCNMARRADKYAERLVDLWRACVEYFPPDTQDLPGHFDETIC